MENAKPKNPIAAFAAERGLRASALAKLIGVSKGAASELINGKRRIGLVTANRMASITGRPWHEFVSAPVGQEPTPPAPKVRPVLRRRPKPKNKQREASL
jgi:transcriptional regulator with XRE-family HTH domain